MSDLDLVGLRKIAEAATQDAWKFADKGSTVTVGTGSYVKSPGAYSAVDLIAEADVDYLEDEEVETVEANYEHIAAFDPPTALALLDRIEELEGELAGYRKREAKSTVQYALKWSNGELNPLGAGSGTALVGIRHQARQAQLSDPYNERPAVLRRSVTFGPWVEVTDDDE